MRLERRSPLSLKLDAGIFMADLSENIIFPLTSQIAKS